MGYSYQNTIDYAREDGEKIGETRGREIGRAEGRAEGEKNKSMDIDRNMQTGGIDIHPSGRRKEIREFSAVCRYKVFRRDGHIRAGR